MIAKLFCKQLTFNQMDLQRDHGKSTTTHIFVKRKHIIPSCKWFLYVSLKLGQPCQSHMQWWAVIYWPIQRA